jgi:zinc protease
MDRTRPPGMTTRITPVNIRPRIFRLRNAIPVYMIRAGSQPVIRLDLTFRAGSWWQSTPVQASSTIAMISEGTKKRSGREIAGILDYHGAYINSSSDRDNAFLTVYFLARHTDIILPLLAEIIREPSFPAQEFQVYADRRKQDFLVEKRKVSSLAREKFALALFGPDHPYGCSFTLQDLDNIQREHIIDFHGHFYHSGNCKIVITGNFDENILAARLDEFFGDEWNSSGIPPDVKAKKQPSAERQIFIPKSDAVQSALRIGRETFERSHPDYPGLLVLNNILGGHFGSRLMQNIREKRGYTYGIGSVLVTFRNSGFMVIVSEVGTGYHKAALKEIYRELSKLCNKPVSARELTLTRNQMLGDKLRDFDGPFATAESIRTLIEHDLETDFHDRIIHTINTITPAQLMELANEYFFPESMYEVVAGQE